MKTLDYVGVSELLLKTLYRHMPEVVIIDEDETAKDVAEVLYECVDEEVIPEMVHAGDFGHGFLVGAITTYYAIRKYEEEVIEELAELAEASGGEEEEEEAN